VDSSRADLIKVFHSDQFGWHMMLEYLMGPEQLENIP
jgi:hypothetical protein